MIQITITIEDNTEGVANINLKQTSDNKTELEEIVATALATIIQRELQGAKE